MKPAAFEYHRPKTVDEAVALLARVAPLDGRVLAGGQTLIPAMALRFARPSHLVDINDVADLGIIREADGALAIGACVRHAAFHRPVTSGPLGSLLAEVVRHIAHYPIRIRGTFCGSLANADPASEWCLVAATLDAGIVARSERTMRTIPASEFFLGFMTTALEADEMIVEARIALLPQGTRFGFYEFSRRAGDFAQAMALATLSVQGGAITEARIGVGGVEAASRRVHEAEEALTGNAPSPVVFEAAAEAAARAVQPIDDPDKSETYCRGLVRAAVLRALQAAEARAR